MNSLRYCLVCGLAPHSILECRDPQIRHTWNYLIRLIDLRLLVDEALENLDDVRSFLEIEAAVNLVPAIGVQYAESNINDSIEDHITHILNRVRFEVLFVNELSLEMRERYLQEQYPTIYRDVPTVIREILPQDIEVIPEERQEEPPLSENSMTVEILVLFIDEPPPVECPICLEYIAFNEINRTKCNHEFCHSCLLRHISTKMTCPLCRKYINGVQVKSQTQSSSIMEICDAYYRRLDSDFDSDYDDMPALIDYEDGDDQEN
jgi:hypothetical protein